MGIGKTLKRVAAYGLKRKNLKNIRKKFGLTSDNKLARRLKRSFAGLRGGAALSSNVPVSASTLGNGYVYSPRTLSQLTGGV